VPGYNCVWSSYSVACHQWRSDVTAAKWLWNYPKCIEKFSLSCLSSLIFSFYPIPIPVIYPILLLSLLTHSPPKRRNSQREIFMSNQQRPLALDMPCLETAYSLPYLQVILYTVHQTGYSGYEGHAIYVIVCTVSLIDSRSQRLQMLVCHIHILTSLHAPQCVHHPHIWLLISLAH